MSQQPVSCCLPSSLLTPLSTGWRAAAAATHHIGFLLLIFMQTFTSGGQGWASLKNPSKAGSPLNKVVGRLPLQSGMKLEAALAAARSELLLKSVTSMFFCNGCNVGMGPTVIDMKALF